MPIITISHQFGSGGRAIGQEVAKQLDLPYIDREIIRGVANRLGISETVAGELDEKADHLIDQLFSAFSWDLMGGMVEPVEQNLVDKTAYTKATQAVLDTICDTGNAVIAGHGANFYLKDRADFLRIFIYGPVASRIERLMKLDGISQPEAAQKVNQKDNERGHYIKSLYRADWRDPNNYHLMINTAVVPQDLAARIIVDACNRCRPPSGKS